MRQKTLTKGPGRRSSKPWKRLRNSSTKNARPAARRSWNKPRCRYADGDNTDRSKNPRVRRSYRVSLAAPDRISENRFCPMIRIHSVFQPSSERRGQCGLKSFGSRSRVRLYGVGDAVTVRVLCIAPVGPLVRNCVDFVVVAAGSVVVVDPCS